MNRHRFVPLFIVACACVGAYLMTGWPHEPTPDLHANSHGTVERPATLGDLHHLTSATQDITLHAFRHLDNPVPIEANPSTLPDWNPDWELRWQDFTTADRHVARVYHATSRQHPSVRFTVTADSENSKVETWERAQ